VPRAPYRRIELEALWARADADGSGAVDLNNLMTLFRKQVRVSSP
jgi:hypothetical protein